MIKQDVYDEVQGLEPLCQEICHTLWNHPELSGNERKSSNYLRKLLSEEGFTIENNEHLEHAFIAQYGEGKPVIAILGEYDALPGLSQKADVTREMVSEDGVGHGCGHHMLGAAATTAAIVIKRFLEKGNKKGTVRFYGCPEEELLSGKVKMAYYHMFDGCDAAVTWHPSSTNMAHDHAYLANASAHFYFHGVSSHAAFAPEQGRSALDAVELMSVGANYLREHVIDRTRIHYSTDSGGFAPNIVPDKASAWYFVRAPHMADVKSTMERLKKVAQGAAMMTETTVDIEMECGCCELSTNEAFADLGVEKPVVFDDVDGLDFEQISDCNPDVILAAYSGMTQEDYDTLSQIAPVIPYKEKAWQTSWREQTIENAEGMGMKPEGEKKVKEVEDLIAEKLEEYPQLEGIPTAFCWISADDFSTFYVYLPTDPRAAYLLDLGLTLPESVQKLAGETDDFNITVSRENADQLDDIQLMVVYGDEDLLKSLQEDKLMSQIPAIKNGAVALVDSTSALAGASTPSILSIPYEIDEYLQLLSDAAENIK